MYSLLRKPTIIFFLLIFSSLGYGQEIRREVCLKDTCVQAEIADSESKRRLGLMFRKSLPENQGMLFSFDRENNYSFWMKNMQFPLDIIYISKDKRIVDIKIDVSPCKDDSCESLVPLAKSKYVLEVNSGFSQKNKIAIGDKVSF